jgi:hypothetical protein
MTILLDTHTLLWFLENNPMSGKYDNAFPNAQKVQIFEQVDTYIENQKPESPEAAFLALAQPPGTGIVQIIQALEQKHSQVNNQQQALEIIDAKFKVLKASQSPQWQDFLSLKRLYNGGKKTAIKVGEHFAQESVWGKGLVAFLEGISEDVK